MSRSVRDVGGCTCGFDRLHANDPTPGCAYHRWAAEEPWNHHCPWNCPNYWDGCNCVGGPFYDPPET